MIFSPDVITAFKSLNTTILVILWNTVYLEKAVNSLNNNAQYNVTQLPITGGIGAYQHHRRLHLTLAKSNSVTNQTVACD